MDTEQRIQELENKSLQVQLQPTEKENLKNNLFEVFTDVISVDAISTYLKVVWKKKEFFLRAGGGQIVVVLTDSSTVTTDASFGDLFTLSTTQSFTMASPTNPTNGKMIIYKIKQDGTGSRIITWDTDFRGSNDLPLPVLTTTADYVDYVGFIYDGEVSKWNCLAINLGFAS